VAREPDPTDLFDVERTFSRVGRSRRLAKDYERLCETAEALIYAAMTRIMIRRPARR
jgi:putative transposase